jgi:UDP-N-acetylmuramoylalanine--D-glutamate ligase
MDMKWLGSYESVDSSLGKSIRRGQHIVFVGLGKRAVSAARVLRARGNVVCILEQKSLEHTRRAWLGDSFLSSAEISELGVVFDVDGEKVVPYLSEACAAILSPGVSVESAVAGILSRLMIPIYSHIELDMHLKNQESVLIVGTNGKTSTASLVATMTKYPSGQHNVWTPAYGKSTLSQYEIFTASALELEASQDLRPRVAACVNAAPAFLERYGSQDRYIATLRKAFDNQSSSDFCVINCDDPNSSMLLAGKPGSCIGISQHPRSKNWIKIDGLVRIEGRQLYADVFGETRKFDLAGGSWTDRHNVYNAAMAVGIATALGVPSEVIQSVLLTCKPEQYRQSWAVSPLSGVPVCNDAKSTNVYATRAALSAARSRYPDIQVVLIMGGIAQDSEWFSFIGEFRDSVCRTVCFGEDASLLAKACSCEGVDAVTVNSFAEAVRLGHQVASEEPKRLLLLSPGCLSLDEFRSYRERGRLFDEYLQTLDM